MEMLKHIPACAAESLSVIEKKDIELPKKFLAGLNKVQLGKKYSYYSSSPSKYQSIKIKVVHKKTSFD